MMNRARRGWWVAGGALLVLALVAGPVSRHATAAALLLEVQAPDDNALGFLLSGELEEDEGEASIESEGAPLPTRFRWRRYRPRGLDDGPPVLLLHGLHHGGIDEPRLIAFARALASARLDVLTPEIEGLTSHRLSTESTETIAHAISWLAERRGRRVGVVGISFAGGLALLALSTPEVRRRASAALIIGGHHDLARVARYHSGRAVRGPRGRPAPGRPNRYGAWVFANAFVEDFFAPPDLPSAREALRLALHDRPDLARQRLEGLSPRGAATMAQLLDRADDQALAEHMDEVLALRTTELAEVSPSGRIRGVRGPVFLLHGRADDVIPALESRHLGRELGHRRAGLVVTSLLGHADAEGRPSARERLAVVHLMARFRAALDDQ